MGASPMMMRGVGGPMMRSGPQAHPYSETALNRFTPIQVQFPLAQRAIGNGNTMF